MGQRGTVKGLLLAMQLKFFFIPVGLVRSFCIDFHNFHFKLICKVEHNRTYTTHAERFEEAVFATNFNFFL